MPANSEKWPLAASIEKTHPQVLFQADERRESRAEDG
jgi:hypothetical protein